MKKILFISVLFLAVFKMQGQILSDSSVRVAGLWNVGDTKNYLITQETYHLTYGEVVSNRQFYRYVVRITIVDVTDDYYLIDWYYQDFEIYLDDIFLMYFLQRVMENLTVTIRTCRLGSFQEIVNWKEMRDLSLDALNALIEDFATHPYFKELLAVMPDFFEPMFAQFETMFSTQEAVLASYQDIQFFYLFHGFQFNLGEEIFANTQQPNLFGGYVDAVTTTWLYEICADYDTFFIQSIQTADSEQLTRLALQHLATLTELGMRPFVESGELTEYDIKVAVTEVLNTEGTIEQEFWTGAVIHATTGWPYKVVRMGDTITDGVIIVQEITIELLQ